MNCREFESIVVDLARGVLADAGAPEGGLAHTDSCVRCAARLSAERALSAALRAAALSAQTDHAPTRLEAALLETFRARHAQPAGATEATTVLPKTLAPQTAQAANVEGAGATARHDARPAAVDINSRRRAAMRPSWWLKVAAALTVALGAGLVTTTLIRRERLAQDGVQGVAGGSAELGRTAPVAVEPQAPTPALISRSEGGAGVLSGGGLNEEDAPTVRDVPGRGARQFVAGGRARFVSAKLGGTRSELRGRVANEVGRPREAIAAATTTQAPEQEIATEYMTLPGAGALMPLDGGHVVRVEVPRATLASFGLPVGGGEQPGARVKADLLLGNDGIARAIRFVR